MAEDTVAVDFQRRAQAIMKRASGHGVDIKPGEPFMDTLEKFLERLDMYRDKPQSSGKILIP